MVKLKSIYLKNYCGYRETFFDFTSNGVPNNFNVFHGYNGIGKSNLLYAINMMSSAHRYMGRDQDKLFRKLIFNHDYDPVYSFLLEKEGLCKINEMEIVANYSTQDGDKEVVLKNNQIVKNELERKLLGHSYLLDADNPVNLNKFQLLKDEWADVFLAFAKDVYNFECTLEKEVKDGGYTFFTDFCIFKYGTKVHFKRMSAGEKKIATMLASLCDDKILSSIDIFQIDNIELHIYFERHPLVVDNLIKYFPNKQFFTTTHSGTLLAHVKDNYNYSWIYNINEYKEKEFEKFKNENTCLRQV